MSRLNREDYDRIDKICQSSGFGSYFDGIECIKFSFEKLGHKLDDEKIKNLNLFELLSLLTRFIAKSNFQEIKKIK